MLYSLYFKRQFDIIISLLLLPLIVPVLTICGLLIKFEDRGPVFYFAKRLGKNKKVFKMYKLRSMKVNSPDIRNEDGSTYNSDKDPRLTKVGKLIRKTSLDELPQILNVLFGDMSFVGPRPDTPEALDYYTDDDLRKLEVRPGITGYSQAYYRNAVKQSEKFKNDIFYVNNISLYLDIKILILTVKNVLTSKNINS
nr:sugar transferase [Paenibacillus sp.]